MIISESLLALGVIGVLGAREVLRTVASSRRAPPVEPRTEAERIASLDPSFRPSVVRLVARMRSRGFDPSVVYGWRSMTTQRELLRKGYTTVDFSFHNATDEQGEPAALAADITDRKLKFGPGSDAFFEALGAEAKLLGLVWGGDWKSFPDPAHVQLLPNSALPSVRARSVRT